MWSKEKFIKHENDKRKEEELRERYNPDNLFKKKGQIVEDNKINQEYTQLIEYKEQNIFKKILSKIMKLFKKNKKYQHNSIKKFTNFLWV